MPWNEPSVIPAKYDWKALRTKEGDALEVQYRHTLESLGKMSGMLGVIFRKAQNRVQDPAKLDRLISMIDSETWTGLDVDVKGSVYEGLLQKNAEDVKTGAGQYFTPRDLIKAIIEVMRPKPDQKSLTLRAAPAAFCWQLMITSPKTINWIASRNSF